MAGCRLPGRRFVPQRTRRGHLTSGCRRRQPSGMHRAGAARQAASGQVDPHATALDQQLHGGATSHAIENILEAADAGKILTGLGALQLTLPTITNSAPAWRWRNTSPRCWSRSCGAGSGASGKHRASTLGTLGRQACRRTCSRACISPRSPVSISPWAWVTRHTGIAAIKSGFSNGPGCAETRYTRSWRRSAISMPRTDPGNIQRWVDLGVDLTLGGVPGNRTFAACRPADLGRGIQSARSSRLRCEGGRIAFNDSLVAHVAVIILGIPAVQDGMHDHGMSLAAMRLSIFVLADQQSDFRHRAYCREPGVERCDRYCQHVQGRLHRRRCKCLRRETRQGPVRPIRPG